MFELESNEQNEKNEEERGKERTDLASSQQVEHVNARLSCLRILATAERLLSLCVCVFVRVSVVMCVFVNVCANRVPQQT